MDRKIYLLLGLLLGLGSCSVQYNVTGPIKNVKGDRSEFVNNPGIFYALPKTEVLVSVPLTIKKLIVGKYKGTWDGCVKACISNKKKAESCDTNKPRVQSTRYVFGDVVVKTHTLADLDHMYRLDLKFGIFHRANHTVEITKEGTMSTAVTEVESLVAETVVNTLKAVKSGTMLTEKTKAMTVMTMCSDFSVDYNNHEEWKLLNSNIKKAREDLLTNRQSVTSSYSEYIAFLEKYEKDLSSHPGAQVFNERKDVYTIATSLPLIATVTPTEGNKYDGNPLCPWRAQNSAGWAKSQPTKFAKNLSKKRNEIVEEKKASVNEKYSKFTKEELEEFECTYTNNILLSAIITATKLNITITPESYSCENNSCAEPKGDGGYRYRLAGFGEVKVTANMVGGKYENTARIPISQYGAIAMLPSKINGRKARLTLDTHTENGSIKKISVGNEPVSSSLPAEIVGIVK